MLRTLLGTLSIGLYLLSLVFFALMILIVAALTYIIPAKKWRHYGMLFAQRFAVYWTDANTLITKLSIRKKQWDVQGEGALNPKGHYLVMSNHRSWIDILVINIVFNRKLPILKFFMKKELLWTLPVAGLACYVLGFPFMERHTKSDIRKNPELKGKDIETTRKACRSFKNTPSTVMNFVEGTRFTEDKKQSQRSPFNYLLKPKAGGVAIVVNEMSDFLDGIINVTIDYEPHDITLWDFAKGNFSSIKCRYEILPVSKEILGNYYEDRPYRKVFQQWLNEVWVKKDELIASFKRANDDA